MPDNSDSDALLSRPVFLANVCHVCKSGHDGKTKLKTCSSCNLIAYCSTEHQRKHWKDHKLFCKVVNTLTALEGKNHLLEGKFVNYDAWRELRLSCALECEKKLVRPLLPYEREMLLFPRACMKCYLVYPPQQLKCCPNCNVVNYCCDDHYQKNHECSQLKLWADITLYQNEHGLADPPLPTKSFSVYQPLPANGMKQVLVTKLVGPSDIMDMGNVLFTCLTEVASYPLSILYALQSLPDMNFKERTEFVLHLVGAELEFEGDAIGKWDVFILHLLPKLVKLTIIFVGPELATFQMPNGPCNEEFRCPKCISDKRKMIVDFQPNLLYHEYCRSSFYTKPDAVCAFNSGLYRETGHGGKDTWGESIPALLQAGSPLILTAYTEVESPKDVERITQTQDVTVLLPPQKNPYQSLRPLRNFIDEEKRPLMYRNQYISVVCKKN